MLAVAAILKRLTAAIAALDPYFNNVSLLVTANGVDGSGNRTFIDSASGLPISIGAGQPTQGSFNPFNSNYAGVFDGSSSLIVTRDASFIPVANENFTIEAWVYLTATPSAQGAQIAGLHEYGLNSDWVFGIDSNLKSYLLINAIATTFTSTNAITLSTWNHVAVSRSGTGSNNLKLFINGIESGSGTTNSTTVGTGSNNLTIGADSANDEAKFTGQISNLRVIKGYALYTSNFTPQAILSNAPLGVPQSAVSLLTLQDGAFVDLSVNNRAITVTGTPRLLPLQSSYPSYRTYDVTKNNAVYFNGSSSYLAMPSNSTLAVGTNNFTIEFWIYLNSVTGTPGIFSTGSPVSQQNNNLYLQFKGVPIRPHIGTVGISEATFGAWTPVANTWYHLAIVRSSTSTNGVTLYVNGISVGSNTLETNITTQQGAYIGGTWDTSYLNGYISNFRFVNGAALYTSNFTPPTAPLTITSNGGATPSVAPTAAQTTLLTCQSNTIIDNSVNNLTITPAGTVSIASGPTYNAYLPAYDPNTCNSVYLSGSYITATGSSSFNLSNSNFTIEFWLNAPTGVTGTLLTKGYVAGSDTGGFTIQRNSDTNIIIYFSSGATWDIVNGVQVAVVANRWNHIAIVRNGTSFTAYVNGVATSLATSSGTVKTTVSDYRIGANASGGEILAGGYISNFRLTVGTALYISAFTPPVEPFTTTFNGGATPSIALTAANQTTILTCRSTTIKDDSNNSFAITAVGTPIVTNRNPFVLNTTSPNTAPIITPAYDSTLHNSVLFDGNSYLYSPSTSATNIGSSFTIEFFIYPLTLTSGMFPLIGRSNNNIQLGFFNNIELAAVGAAKTAGINYIAAATTPILSAWNHIAICRSGTGSNQTSIFLNGSRVANGTVSQDFNVTGALFVGGSWVGGLTNCYISNLRIVDGSDVYGVSNTQITVPTTALSVVSGSGITTKLLTCQSSTFVDNSPNNHSITNTNSEGTKPGNPTVTTLNPFGVSYSDYKGGFYGGSGYFDGSSYLTATNSSLGMGTDNFTIEAWIYTTSSAEQNIVATRGSAGSTTAFSFALNTSRQLYFYTNAAVCTTTSSIPLNTWVHVAFVKAGTGANQCTIYINGVSSATGTNAQTLSDTTLGIGSARDGTQYPFFGYISNLRIIKGSALYTSNFAPPTAPVRPTANSSLLLNFANAGVYDITRKNNLIQYGTASVSTSASKFGGGAMYFDGSSHLAAVSGDNFNFGTGDFTVEMWTYPTANTKTYPSFLELGNHVNTTGILFLQQSTSGNIPQIYSGAFYTPTSTPALTLNTWNHLVYQRTSGNLRIFVNGVGSNTLAFTNNLTDTRPTIGSAHPGATNYYFTGYIDDLRITKGVARYTSNFAVPTRELPNSNVSLPDSDPYFNNVSLLLRGDGLSGAQNNTFLDSSVNNTTVTRIGSPTQGSFSPFSTLGNVYNVGVNGGSGYFDGSSSYLAMPSNSTLAVGTNNFTIEFWIYFNSVTGTPGIFSTGSPVSQQNGNLFLQIKGSPKQPYIGVIGTSEVTFGTWTPVANTWYHLAIVRSSTSTNGVTLYVNGISVGSNTLGTNITTQQGAYIGGTWERSFLNGYISNFRFVNGAALYTSNFTPPTAPVTLTSNGGATPSTAPTAAQTRLLLNFTNGGIVDAVGKNNLITVGNASVDTAIKKYGTGSMAFNGTTDYLTVPSSTTMNLGSSDYTIEGWLYHGTQSNTFAGIYNGATSGGMMIGIKNNNTISLSANNIGELATYSYTPQLNTWYHLALTRKNQSNFNTFINGLSVQVTTVGGVLQNTGYFTNGNITGLGSVNPGTTSDFCFEAWIKPDTGVWTGDNIIFQKRNDPTNLTSLIFLVDSSYVLRLQQWTGTAFNFAIGTINSNSWNHVALYRVSGSVYGSVNGVVTPITGLVTTDFDYFPGLGFVVGGFTDTRFKGWMSNVRFVIGSSVYTSNNFSVPISSLQVIPNTRFLLLTAPTNGSLGVDYSGNVTPVATSVTFSDQPVYGISTVSFTQTPTYIGGGIASQYYNGYIDDLRVTKGVARYTSNFTPPTAPVPIEGTGNTIIIAPFVLDGSTAARAASSAQAIKNLTGTTTNGIYWILVGGVPTEIYCDMNTDGGGWMSFAAVPGTGNWSGIDTGSQVAWSGLSFSSGTYDKNGGTATSYWRNYSSQSPTQVLFKTGNSTYWMRMLLSQIVAAGSTATYTSNIATSNNFPSDANNYNSSVSLLYRSNAEDPWINVGNTHAVGNNYMFWGENGNPAHITFKNANGGILAFVK